MLPVKMKGVIAGIREINRLISILWKNDGNILMEKNGLPFFSTDPVQVILDMSFDDRAKNAGLSVLKSTCRDISGKYGGKLAVQFVMLTTGILDELIKNEVVFGTHQLIKKSNEEKEIVKDHVAGLSRNIWSMEHIRGITDKLVDNRDLSEAITGALLSVGKSGNVVVECGKGTDSEFVVRDGIEIPFGTKLVDRCHSDQPMVAVLNYGLSSFSDIQSILEECSVLSRPIVVFAKYIERDALATWHLNKEINGHPWYPVCINTVDSLDWMGDIASLSDATIIEKGSTFELDSLGSVQSMDIDAKRSTMCGYEVSTLGPRVKYLRSEAEKTSYTYDRDRLLERASRLDSGYCVLRAGGKTDPEIKYNRRLAESAIQTLSSSLKGGVVPGYGLALFKASKTISLLSDPFSKLYSNLFEYKFSGDVDPHGSIGVNPVSGEVEDFYISAITEPTLSLIEVIELSVSTANSVFSCMK